jgi:hypothetical protein
LPCGSKLFVAKTEDLRPKTSIAMSRGSLRRQVAFEAARLMYARDESTIHRARLRAAQKVLTGRFHPRDLPTTREILTQIEEFARADQRELDRENLGRLRDVSDPIGRFHVPDAAAEVDRFHVYHSLLAPLETVKEDRQEHPEGDSLYHSLQVFTLARESLPYDEEFLLAALLHDVGKAIDPRDHVTAALEVLAGFVTARTAWLIEHHEEALELDAGTLGVRSQRRLQASPDFEELRLLARCDRDGRRTGVATPDVIDALDYIRALSDMCGE